MSTLPGILGEIEEAAGLKAALALAQQLGGTTMKFSGRKNSALAKVVGDAAAAKIAKALGPGPFVIPMAGLRGARGRRERAARLLANGAKVTQAALAVDVHERTIKRLKAKAKKAETPEAKKTSMPLLDWGG